MSVPSTPSEALAAAGVRVLDMSTLTDPAPAGIIVTVTEDVPAGSRLWVRYEHGEPAVDCKREFAGSWSLGQFHGLTAEVAP